MPRQTRRLVPRIQPQRGLIRPARRSVLDARRTDARSSRHALAPDRDLRPARRAGGGGKRGRAERRDAVGAGGAESLDGRLPADRDPRTFAEVCEGATESLGRAISTARCSPSTAPWRFPAAKSKGRTSSRSRRARSRSAAIRIETVVGHARVHGVRATIWCAGTTCRGDERFYSIGWCERGTEIVIGGGSEVTRSHLIRVARSVRALPGGTTRPCS